MSSFSLRESRLLSFQEGQESQKNLPKRDTRQELTSFQSEVKEQMNAEAKVNEEWAKRYEESVTTWMRDSIYRRGVGTDFPAGHRFSAQCRLNDERTAMRVTLSFHRGDEVRSLTITPEHIDEQFGAQGAQSLTIGDRQIVAFTAEGLQRRFNTGQPAGINDWMLDLVADLQSAAKAASAGSRGARRNSPLPSAILGIVDGAAKGARDAQNKKKQSGGSIQ